jgi:hypothetical protein
MIKQFQPRDGYPEDVLRSYPVKNEPDGPRVYQYLEAIDGELPQEKKDQLMIMLTSDNFELSFHPKLGDKDMVFYAKNKKDAEKLAEWVKKNIPTAYSRRKK